MRRISPALAMSAAAVAGAAHSPRGPVYQRQRSGRAAYVSTAAAPSSTSTPQPAARPLRPLSRVAYERRVARLRIPGPSDARVVRGTPPGSTWDPNEVAATIDNTIYAPDGLDAHSAGHEAFHVMQRLFSPVEDGVLAKRVGMPGNWLGTDANTPTTAASTTAKAAEVRAAEWYAAAVQGVDPGRQWFDSRSAAHPPSRRQMLRFLTTLDRLGRRYGLPAYTRPH
jgi:hypothetical protein